MKEMIILKDDANQRLDKYLLKTLPNLSQSMMYKAIRNKKIKVNRKRAQFNQLLKEKDSVLLFLPEDVCETKERKINPKLPLNIPNNTKQKAIPKIHFIATSHIFFNFSIYIPLF